MPFMLFSCANGQTTPGEFVKSIEVQNSRFQGVGRSAARTLVGVVALGVLSLVCSRFQLNAAAASSVFLLVVIVQSLTGDFASSAAVSLAAFGYLDYFFTIPVFSFAVAGPLEFLDLATFLATALVVTQLVSRFRREAHSSNIERQRTERLYKLAQELLLLEPKTTIDARCLEPFRQAFELRSVCLFDGDAGELVSIGVSGNSLSDRTGAAYMRQTDEDDRFANVSTRCLRVGGKTRGAIGFEGLEDAGYVAGPAAALAATFLERVRSLRSASLAVVTAQSEAYRSAILDALAHEFKTPLATILAAAGGLQEAGPLVPQQAEMTATVEAEAARLGRLTSRLLRMARLDREEVRPQMEWVDVVSLAEQVLDRHRRLRTGRHLSLLKGCESAEALADPELLSLALNQLLDNACKYSDPGATATISVDAHDGIYSIRVSNTGSSIPSIDRRRIFERYYRGTQARNFTTGSGLGLYVARKIALALGGNLELEDRPAADGVTFRLTIPASKAVDHELDHDIVTAI
jgi:two-component system sensor histidine kinase KdpD